MSQPHHSDEDEPQEDGTWVNAVVEFLVPLDVSVAASNEEKMQAAEDAFGEDFLFQHEGASLSFETAGGRSDKEDRRDEQIRKLQARAVSAEVADRIIPAADDLAAEVKRQINGATCEKKLLDLERDYRVARAGVVPRSSDDQETADDYMGISAQALVARVKELETKLEGAEHRQQVMSDRHDELLAERERQNTFLDSISNQLSAGSILAAAIDFGGQATISFAVDAYQKIAEETKQAWVEQVKSTTDSGNPACDRQQDEAAGTDMSAEDRAALAEDRATLAEIATEDVLAERDHLHDIADQLSYALGGGIEAIGEHSSCNDPWQNALDDQGQIEQARVQERERIVAFLEAMASRNDLHGLSIQPTELRRLIDLRINDQLTVAAKDNPVALVELTREEALTMRLQMISQNSPSANEIKSKLDEALDDLEQIKEGSP